MVACRAMLLVAMLALVAGTVAEEHVSLDPHDSAVEQLGESEGASNFGYFCTPSGQNNPDFAYNDKDCAANKKKQNCGEVWCCSASKYSCLRKNRVADAKCGSMAKPICGGTPPTPSAKGPDGKIGCVDKHDSLCEAAKAYGHCKHASYAAACPKACGSCGVPNAPSTQSIIAQAKAKVQQRTLDPSNDAQAVASHAMSTQHEAVRRTNMASDSVAAAQAVVAQARRDLRQAQERMNEKVDKAENAGKDAVHSIEKRANAKVLEAKADAKKAKAVLRGELSQEEATKDALRSAENAAARAGGGNVRADKAALKEAKGAERSAQAKLEKAKTASPKAPSSLVAKEAAEAKAAAKAGAKLQAAKDRVASDENKVADEQARVKALQYQESEAPGAAGQVQKVTNSLQRSNQALNSQEAALVVVKKQAAGLKAKEVGEEAQKSQDKAAAQTALAGLKQQEKVDAKKDAQAHIRKDAKKEEKKLEEKAVEKVTEMAIAKKKGAELKEEAQEEVADTDATLEAKSEAAFLRANTKIDDIFDDVKPLVLGLKPPPHITFTEHDQDFVNGGTTGKGKNGAQGTGKVIMPAATAESEDRVREAKKSDDDAKAMTDRMLESREKMRIAGKKITQLKEAVESDDTDVKVPGTVLRAAKSAAKKVADKEATKEGKKEGCDDAKKAEQQAARNVASKTAAKVSADNKAIQETKKEEEEVKAREQVVAAKVAADKADVKDLKGDLKSAQAEVKADTVPAAKMEKAESGAAAAEAKLRKAKESVAADAAAKSSAEAGKASAAAKIASAKQRAESKLAKKEQSAEDKIGNTRNGVIEAKSALEAAESKAAAAKRLKAKVARLKGDLREEKSKAAEDKEAAKEDVAAAHKARDEADSKVEAAKEKAAGVTDKALEIARQDGNKSVEFAKMQLKRAQVALEAARKNAENKASLAGVKAKVCRKLVPGNSASKDEATLCLDIKKEAHCNLFDYARYCAKSCGTCLL